MDKKQIVKHPDYTAQSPNYKLWEDLVEGGDRVEKEESYLPQHAYESNPQYKIRKQLATYKNHAQPIVTVFTSSIWRKPPVRELPEALEKYVKNVDGLGTAARAFFRDADEKAASVGLHFLVVDATKPPKGEENATLADSKKLGIRPYFALVSSLNVIDWGFDGKGLAYIVISESEAKDVGPFDAQERVQKYRIWFRDRWELWVERDDKLFVEGRQAHPCGEVPVRPLYFRKKKEMVGESCIKDVARLLLRAYMLENALDKSLFDTAFPQQYFFGFESEDIEGYIKASSNGLVSNREEAKSGFIEPNGQSFEALDSKVKRDEVSIREIALRMVRPDSKVGESAEAKRIDKQQLDSQLSVFSQNCEDAEVWAWSMMLKWLKAENQIEKIKVQYNRDFDVAQISGDLLKAFSEMRRNRDLSRDTMWKILEAMEFQFPEDFDPVDEAAKIENEQRSTTGFGAMGSKLLNRTGQ